LSPELEDRVYHTPCPLDFVEADEVRGVATHYVEQQSLVGIRGRLLVAAIACVKADYASVHTQSGLARVYFHVHAFGRLQTQDDPVGFQIFQRRLVKQLLRRMAKANGDHRLLPRQPLACAQIKRHATPAPVVDEKLGGHVGLCGGVLLHVRLVEITWDRLAVHISPGVLSTKSMDMQGAALDRADGAQDLDLLIAERVGLQGWRRLHRNQREQLHHVILKHVAQRASFIVITGARFDAGSLRHCNLDVVYEVAVPYRLDHEIGETEHQQVLHRFFAQVVVDTKDLLLVEVLVHHFVEHASALQILAERFLHHQSVQSARPVQSDRSEILHHCAEIGRFDCQVIDEVRAHTGLGFAQLGEQAPITLDLLKVTLHIAEAPYEALEYRCIEERAQARPQRRLHVRGPSCLIEGAPAVCDEVGYLGQTSFGFEVVQCWEQFRCGQVTRRAEDYETAGIDRVVVIH